MITQTKDDGLKGFLDSIYVPSRLEITPGAVRQIEVAIRQIEQFAGRPLSVYDLTEDLLRRFLAEFRGSHAAATTNSRRRDLLALWRCAFDEGIIDRPPRRGKIRRAKDAARIPEAWSPPQVASILEACRSDALPVGGLSGPAWWRSILLVLYDTGARLGECLAVESADLSITDCWVVFRTTKTRRERWAAIHEETARACEAIYNNRRPLVWPLGITRQQLDRRFRKILDRAGLPYRPGVLFRRLRQTSGTLIEANGGDGARHLGNGRAVFERHYRDPRFMPNQLGLLPRPK
jgi:integrase